MKFVILILTLASTLSAYAQESSHGDCKIQLDDKILNNMNDFSFSNPSVTVKMLKKKGYKVNAIATKDYKKIVLSQDFSGDPNLVLDVKMFNQVTEQQMGGHLTSYRGPKVYTAVFLALRSVETNEVLAETESESEKSDGILKLGLFQYPNHTKKAVSKLPSCKSLNLSL